MIAAISSAYDSPIADFWVQAWQGVFPEIDFEARRPWIVDHLAHMQRSGQIARAYFEQDRPVAFYTLFPATGLIEQICVSPSAAGRGIGAMLVADAGRHSHHTLNLVVNEDNKVARQFYVKIGFVETGRGMNSQGTSAALTMEMTAKSA